MKTTSAIIAILIALCSVSHAEIPQTLRQDLEREIQSNETKLLNVRVEGSSYSERWNDSSQEWEYNGEDHATSWFEGVPRGKRRIDHHKWVAPWVDGLAPFLEQTISSIYDGRISQTLQTRSGPSNAVSSSGSGDIEPGLSLGVASAASGWGYSLYGAYEHSGYISRLFTSSPVTQLLVQKTSFNGIECIKLDVFISGLRTVTFWFDPQRSYALIGCDNYYGDGSSSIARSMIVHELSEVAPGVYYPTKATSQSNLGNGMRTRSRFEASSVVANDPKFSDDIFTMNWPPQTRVRDLISSNSFVVGETKSR